MDTVLLINDSPTLTKFLTAHFAKAGLRVIAVPRVIDAFEAFLRNDVHLILTDYVLPDRDGMSVIETFRLSKKHVDLPIVVFTASAEAGLEARCKQAGAALVLSKTDDLAAITRSIEKLIEEFKSRMPSHSIDADLGACIVKATSEVFKTMMQMKVVPGDIIVEKAKPRNAQVIGSIGVAGFLSGSISVFLDRAFAATSAAKMLMLDDPLAISDEELVDAVGELVNMIGGNIKTALFKKTPLFDISVPSVYVGQDLRRRTISDDLCFLVPFTFEKTAFQVEFLMITKKDGEGTGVQASLLAGKA